MNIIIFGSTGKTGYLLTEQTLAQGHKVTAFVRSPEKMTISHANLAVMQGDVYNPPDVDKAMVDQDIVFVSLGNSSLGKTNIRTDGTKQVISAMKRESVDRLIVLSSLGIGDSRGQRTLFAKLLLNTLIRNVVADHATQEEAVMKSELIWTIVRPPLLTDGPKSGDYRYGLADDLSLKSNRISRADVADFMVKQIDSVEFLNKAATIV